jgi:hypothetical protein
MEERHRRERVTSSSVYSNISQWRHQFNNRLVMDQLGTFGIPVVPLV